MKRYLRRLVWKCRKQRFTSFLQLGIIHTLFFAILFTFFADSDRVRDLRLFEFTEEYLPDLQANLWGLLMFVVVMGHVCEMIFRGRGFGPATAMLGFMLWVYASVAYVILDMYLFVPLVCFWPLAYWAWYYVSSVQYHRELDMGIVDPVD